MLRSRHHRRGGRTRSGTGLLRPLLLRALLLLLPRRCGRRRHLRGRRLLLQLGRWRHLLLLLRRWPSLLRLLGAALRWPCLRRGRGNLRPLLRRHRLLRAGLRLLLRILLRIARTPPLLLLLGSTRLRYVESNGATHCFAFFFIGPAPGKSSM